MKMTQKEKIKHFESETGKIYNKNATSLDARGCDKLTTLPDMPALKTLDARGCDKLTALPDMPALEYLYASGCDKLTALPDMPALKTLDARGCDKLKDKKILKEKSIFSKSIGSRYAITEFWIDSDEIKCGCFKGNLKDFESKVKSTYPNGKHHDQYVKFINKCKRLIKAK